MVTSNFDRELNLCRQYQYIKIQHYNFCLQQSAAILCWILYFKRRDLNSIFTPWLKQSSPRRILGHVRFHYRKISSVFKALILFLIYKLKMGNVAAIINLPVYGHFCLRVHKGYKIFNFRTRTAIKIFDRDVNKGAVIKEIEQLKNISEINFAPTLSKWNVDEKWYEEEFVSGYQPSYYKSQDSIGLLTSIKSDIVPCLIGLMAHKPIKSMSCSDYVNKIIGILQLIISSKETDIKETSKIREFVYSIVDRLSSMGNAPIYLVFSHGDFCPANMLTTLSGIKILDWESAEYRSALFDFYSFFFYRPVCIDLSVDQIIPEINEALPALASALALKPSDIPESILSLEHIYRRIFYIELMCRLVDRERTDNNLDIMNFISRYIDAFNHYEDIVARNLAGK